MLWVKVNFHSGEPVYKQIVDNIIGNIISGKLHNDQPVPSIRELARDLNINPNTVARAYRELEAKGYIYSRPGVGSFIKGIDDELMQKKAADLINGEIWETAKKAKKYKLSRQKFTEMVSRITGEVYGGDK